MTEFDESRTKKGNEFGEVKGVCPESEIRLLGHLNHYNTDACRDYRFHATQILYKWLNRKSQRKGYNWDQFNQVLDLLDWPTVKIRKDLNPFRREEAC
jgi:hypothetical protein